MFRLIKLAFSLAALAAFAWFGLTVKLGDQTLFQHLRAIGSSKESQDLVDGTRQAAGPLVDDVRRRISRTGGADEAHADKAQDSKIARVGEARVGDDGGAPQERLTPSDQDELNKLVRRVDRRPSGEAHADPARSRVARR